MNTYSGLKWIAFITMLISIPIGLLALVYIPSFPLLMWIYPWVNLMLAVCWVYWQKSYQCRLPGWGILLVFGLFLPIFYGGVIAYVDSLPTSSEQADIMFVVMVLGLPSTIIATIVSLLAGLIWMMISLIYPIYQRKRKR